MSSTQDNLLDAPISFRKVLLKKCNSLWKDHKAKTKAQFFTKKKNDPNLHMKVPPNIVPEQWPVLVAYWRSTEAEMQQSGEPIDKMSVWLKSRNPNDHDVIDAHLEYQELLDKEPEDQRNLISVKDKIFHILMGKDGHGYCRTYGPSMPPKFVYPHDFSPSVANCTLELVNNIIEQVTKKLSDEFDEKQKKLCEEFAAKQEILTRQWGMKYDEMASRINELESNQGEKTIPLVQVHPDATSGHLIESIGYGLHTSPSDQEPILNS